MPSPSGSSTTGPSDRDDDAAAGAVGGVDVDDATSVLVVLACLAPMLLIAPAETTMRSSSPVLVRSGRSVALDALRGIAIMLIIVENLAMYDWGVKLHRWPLTAWWLAAFEHLGLTLFVATLGASLVLSTERQGGDATRRRHRRLLALGVLDAVLVFALDVLAQLALIGLVGERVLRRPSRLLLATAALASAALVLATQLVSLGEVPATWGPTSLLLQPTAHLLEALVSFGANLLTAPMYLGITVMTAMIVQRCTATGGPRAAWAIVGPALLAAAVLLGVASTHLPPIAFEAQAVGMLRHALIISGAIITIACAARRHGEGLRLRTLSALGQATLSGYLLAGLAMVVVSSVRPAGVTSAIAIASATALAVLMAPAVARHPQGPEAYVRGR